MALKVAPRNGWSRIRDTHRRCRTTSQGWRALQEHKFEKAKGHLQKALTGPDKALVDGHRCTS